MDREKIYILQEAENGKLKSVGLEMISGMRPLADEMGAEIHAVIVGYGIGALLSEPLKYGANAVLYVDEKRFDSYLTENYTRVLMGIISDEKPYAFLVGATINGRDLAPRIAARLNTGLTADCTGVALDDRGEIIWTRPTLGGNLLADIVCENHSPRMGTIRPGAFVKRALPYKTDGLIRRYVPDLTRGDPLISDRVRIVESVRQLAADVNLEEAKIIFAGGMGIGSPKGFELLKELAKKYGGEVACTRAVVEAGWMPYAHQVGQSGKIVSPDLYFAFGISGAIQHNIGFTQAKKVIAINSDPDADIFKQAHVGIIEDWKKAANWLLNM